MHRLPALLEHVVVVVFITASFTACETGFEELNTNPTEASSIQADFLFTSSLMATAGTRYEQWRSNLIYPEAMMQHLTNTWWAGEKYLQPGNEDWATALWLVAYNGNGDSRRAYIKTLQDLIANNEDDPEAVNKIATARILRAFAFHRITDMYGDIPYFEGGKGFIADNVTPAFDPQSEIYADMLNELQEAVASFNRDLPTYGDADVLYGGNIDKWRRFANSLMLRLGLRLVKVDPGMAQQWVQRAIAGGVMESNDDSAVILHANGPDTGPNGLNSNGIGDVLAVDSPLLTETFVNYLRDRGDPRLRVFGAILSGLGHTGGTVLSSDPEDQVGWPVGNDLTTIQSHPAWDPERGVSVFSQPPPMIRGLDEPTFLLTYAEVQFRLAEAAVRGWHSGDPAAHYANGTRAAMQHVALYDPAGGANISAAEIDAYLAANPYDPANALEQINTALWAALFFNGFEAWANWRRTGFPVLQPVNYPGNVTAGTIPRRMTYPTGERILNTESYNAAVARQGPDAFTTRVWWDVAQ